MPNLLPSAWPTHHFKPIEPFPPSSKPLDPTHTRIPDIPRAGLADGGRKIENNTRIPEGDRVWKEIILDC
jgi:hypothetical protein